jgi:hypothetical protein
MHVAMQKYWKKRREKKYKKWTSVQENKTMGNLKPEKKEMNKIAHVFFTKYSSIFIKRSMFSRSNIRIRISHHIHLSYIHHIPYICTS